MKSHVGMGHEVCPICGVQHSTTVLLDTRLRNSLEKDNFTGYSLCPEHAALAEEYVALVECSNAHNSQTLRPENANRTGKICHIRRSVAGKIFNVDLPQGLPLVFVEVGVISRLEEMTGA